MTDWMTEVGADVFGNVFDRFPQFSGYFVEIRIRVQQLALVVEHFLNLKLSLLQNYSNLKMRDMPNGIDGIAVKSFAHMVVNAALVHLLESQTEHFECVVGLLCWLFDGEEIEKEIEVH